MQHPLIRVFGDMHALLQEKGQNTGRYMSPQERTKAWVRDVRQHVCQCLSGLFSETLFYYVTNEGLSSGMPFYSLLIEPHKIELVETPGQHVKRSEFSLQTDQVLIDKHDASQEEAGFFLRKLAFVAQDIHVYQVPVLAEKKTMGRRT